MIERIRTILPDTALGTDVIVGYPGETEKLFQETAERVAELPFTYLHIFRYSPREGTVAARMTEQVPEPVKKERSAVLREIGIKKKKQYAQRFVGKTMPILVENRLDDGNYSGLTPNYLRTMVNMAKSTEQRASFTNTIILARLIERNGFNLVGELHHE